MRVLFSYLLIEIVYSVRNGRRELLQHELIALREETREAFLHSYNSYLKYGYPHDEVMPISCKARRFNNRTRGNLDDVLGGYMLTLVDSLDTLLLMREFNLFKDAMGKLANLSFNRDVEISVFEVNIRVLGGLLSAHQLALILCDTSVYDGYSLLKHAIDLGRRLLPAFATTTGIPQHRVNLKTGLIPDESTLTCTAAGGTFLLEMGLLSRLTGDSSFEVAAYKALKALWMRRSPLGLVGSMIDTVTGLWQTQHTGIGAGIDSFYETMLKGYILFGDRSLLLWFEEAYNAVQKHTLFNVCICTATCYFMCTIISTMHFIYLYATDKMNVCMDVRMDVC